MFISFKERNLRKKIVFQKKIIIMALFQNYFLLIYEAYLLSKGFGARSYHCK